MKIVWATACFLSWPAEIPARKDGLGEGVECMYGEN